MACELQPKVRDGLLAAKVSPEVVDALAIACKHAAVNKYAYSHAHGITAAFAEYKVDGVKMNVLYMLGNMVAWQGIEARATKKILKKWSSR